VPELADLEEPELGRNHRESKGALALVCLRGIKQLETRVQQLLRHRFLHLALGQGQAIRLDERQVVRINDNKNSYSINVPYKCLELLWAFQHQHGPELPF